MDSKSLLYSASDETIQRFYQLPKIFDIEPFYRKMSLGAKYMYAVLRDRQDLSIQNGWLDKKGYTYFYFDCNKLSELLNVSTSTLNKYKKELIKHYLLLQVRQGQGVPNRMYILKPVTIENALNSENCISSVAKIAFLEILKSLTNDTDINDTELITLNRYTITSDTAHSFLSLYLSVYADNFNEKHPRVKMDRLQFIEDSINDIIETLSSKEEQLEMITDYFYQLNEENNGNILAFLTAKDRYLTCGQW